MGPDLALARSASGQARAGEPWPKKKAGMRSGVAGRASRARVHCSRVSGSSGAAEDIGGCVRRGWRRTAAAWESRREMGAREEKTASARTASERRRTREGKARADDTIARVDETGEWAGYIMQAWRRRGRTSSGSAQETKLAMSQSALSRYARRSRKDIRRFER